MGLIIEMLGSPGAGKTTMVAAVADGCRDRQLRVFDESGGDMQAVVDHILEETMLGVE